MRDLRVVEVSASIAGAYCTRLLRELGADVVCAEPPGGSPLRLVPPLVTPPVVDGEPRPARSTLHEYLDAGKRSVTLDPAALTDAEDATFDELAAWADVVVSTCDGDPDAARALFARIQAANPAAVHVVVSGYGLTGPWSSWRSSPLTDWAAGGHMYLTGEPDREPLQGGGPWDSYLTGGTAAIGAQAAVLDASVTGLGQLVDVGAMEAMASAHQWSLTMFTHVGVVKRRWGRRFGESYHPMTLYAGADGGWIMVGAPTKEQWEQLCRAIGAEVLLEDERLYAPGERFDRADEIDAFIAPWAATLSAVDAVQHLQEHRVTASKALDMAELLVDRQMAARHFFPEVGHLGAGARMPAGAFGPEGPLGHGGRTTRPAPDAGQDTAEVRAEVRAALATPTTTDPTTTDPTTASPGATAPVGVRVGTPRVDLRGVRVIELTLAWAGPLAGRFLGDLGADVIKIEQPDSRGHGVGTGDRPPWTWGELPDAQIRASVFPEAEPGERWWNRMGIFNKMNRSKRSLALDIKAPGGREVFHELVAGADLVLQNFSPRGARSVGVDHESLLAVNPRIVSVAMSGYGRTGPMAAYASYGPILEAHAGFDEATGYAGDGPLRLGLAYPDAVGGVHGAVAALGALWEHRRTGRDVFVDISQLETLASMAGDQLLESSLTGHAPPRHGNRSPGDAPQGAYPCAGDDEWIAVTVDSDAAWVALVTLSGLDALRDPAFGDLAGRMAGHEAIDATLSAWTAGQDRFALAERLQAAGIVAAPIMTNRDLVQSAHLAERGFMVDWDQPDVGVRTFPGFPIHFGRWATALAPAPRLGGHNVEVLEALGRSTADIEALLASGTIATAPPR